MKKTRFLPLIVGIGLLLAAWTRPWRGLFDLTTGTVVEAMNPSTTVIINGSVSSSGSFAVYGAYGGEADLAINLGTVSAGSLTFTVADADPQNPTTALTGGTSCSTSALSSAGLTSLSCVPMHSSAWLVSWEGAASMTGVYVTLTQKYTSANYPGTICLSGTCESSWPTGLPYWIAADVSGGAGTLTVDGGGYFAGGLVAGNGALTFSPDAGSATANTPLLEVSGGGGFAIEGSGTDYNCYSEINSGVVYPLLCADSNLPLFPSEAVFDDGFEDAQTVYIGGAGFGNTGIGLIVGGYSWGDSAGVVAQGLGGGAKQVNLFLGAQGDGGIILDAGTLVNGYLQIKAGSRTTNLCVSAQGGCSMSASSTSCTVACSGCTSSSSCFSQPYTNSSGTDAIGVQAQCATGTVTLTAKTAPATGAETFNVSCFN